MYTLLQRLLKLFVFTKTTSKNYLQQVKSIESYQQKQPKFKFVNLAKDKSVLSFLKKHHPFIPWDEFELIDVPLCWGWDHGYNISTITFRFKNTDLTFDYDLTEQRIIGFFTLVFHEPSENPVSRIILPRELDNQIIEQKKFGEDVAELWIFHSASFKELIDSINLR